MRNAECGICRIRNWEFVECGIGNAECGKLKQRAERKKTNSELGMRSAELMKERA
jgi:hypothetical protein